MEFSVKNVKTLEAASTDSLCFEASLYIDGKRVAIVSDDGRGGCCEIRPLTKQDVAKIDRARQWVKDNPITVVTDMKNTDGSVFTYDKSLEDIITELVTDHSVLKIVKQRIKQLRKKVYFITNGELRGCSAKISPAELDEKDSWVRKRLAEKYPGCVIINDLTEDEAVAAYREIFNI